jgi:DGQHR domain-containing protein
MFMKLRCFLGKSADKQIIQGCAPAKELYNASFADVLEEATGKGYQRRYNRSHSLDFRKYIHRKNSSTIPLTLNLRPEFSDFWTLKSYKNNTAELILNLRNGPVFSQVDCQHRLGCMSDSDVILPFMSYIGLSLREEIELFGIINGKSKGLSTSLLDFHQTKLLENVSKERPELFIAVKLNEDESSPWYKRLDLGGKATVGLNRKASLRTMQKGIMKFLKAVGQSEDLPVEELYLFVRNFWKAVSEAQPEHWENPRGSFLLKGIGVYALMRIAADIFLDSSLENQRLTPDIILIKISDYVNDFDWTNSGPLRGLGGESGANEAYEILRSNKLNQLRLFVS